MGRQIRKEGRVKNYWPTAEERTHQLEARIHDMTEKMFRFPKNPDMDKWVSQLHYDMAELDALRVRVVNNG